MKMESDEIKKLKQEIMELSIELAKMQDEIDELKKYKTLFLAEVSKVTRLEQIIKIHNIKF